MTVDTTIQRQYFDGDGLNKNFPFNFKFFDNSTVYVSTIDADGDVTGLTEGINYTLTGAGSKSGGKVVMTSAPGLGFQVMIERILQDIQTTSFRNQGAFFPAVHEDAFDKLVMLIQQALAGIQNSLKTDRSGRFWDFLGKRGINAADPVNAQDVVTKGWVGRYIDSVSGLINTTLGISYDAGSLFDYLRFGVARSVDTIAALRALSSSRNQRAFVFGYYAKGDLGGGPYYVDPSDTTSADNGSTIIVASDGARWKLRHDGFITLKQAGCRGDGLTDDTARIQAAVNSGVPAIYVNPVDVGYRTTAPVVINRSLTIRGEGVKPFSEGGPYNSKGYGSWFFLDHPGRGFTAETSVSATFIATVYYDKIGTYRKHLNAVAVGWTPTVFDFDFAAKNADVFYTNLMLLNPYRGIFHTNGNGGRVTIDQVRGQFMSQAIYIETTQDSTRISNLHDWPFWVADPNVTSWQTANKNCISLGRCDNPLISNIFSIYTSNGIYIFNYVGDAFNSGSVSKLKAANVDFDQTWNWLTTETGANDVTAQFSNVSVFGPAPSTFSHGALIKGNYSRLDFVNYHAEAVSNEAMYIQGTGNIVKVLNARAKNYARLNSATPAFFCDTGNVLEIGNRVQTEGIGTVLLSGNGNITYPQGSTRGTVILAAAATTVVVTHNLPMAPSVEQIQLTLGGPIGAAKALYVTAVSATTFTITSEVAASASVSIHWRAALE